MKINTFYGFLSSITFVTVTKCIIKTFREFIERITLVDLGMCRKT